METEVNGPHPVLDTSQIVIIDGCKTRICLYFATVDHRSRCRQCPHVIWRWIDPTLGQRFLEAKGGVPAGFTFITRMSLAVHRRFQRLTAEGHEWAPLKACQHGKYCCITSCFSLTPKKKKFNSHISNKKPGSKTYAKVTIGRTEWARTQMSWFHVLPPF